MKVEILGKSDKRGYKQPFYEETGVVRSNDPNRIDPSISFVSKKRL